MPSRARPLWILTIALLVAAPVANIVYWERVLASGVLASDKDSVAIPMAAGILVALLLAPVVVATAWICLRRYNPRTTLLAWDRGRPVRSLVASLVFGGPASVLAVVAVDALTVGFPAREDVFAALCAPGILWLLAMRAAFIDQVGPGPACRLRTPPRASPARRGARSG